jgi:hypothetical protein
VFVIRNKLIFLEILRLGTAVKAFDMQMLRTRVSSRGGQAICGINELSLA